MSVILFSLIITVVDLSKTGLVNVLLLCVHLNCHCKLFFINQLSI